MLCQRCKKRDATITNQYADGSPAERYCDECASIVIVSLSRFLDRSDL